MPNKKIIACLAVLLAVVCMAEAREENPHDIADTLRMLQELDRIYSQAARPSNDNRKELDQFHRNLREIQEIWEKKLSCLRKYHKNRPRYGKRSTANNWATNDVEKQDIPDWLAYARRR